jgi:uncharacterized protein
MQRSVDEPPSKPSERLAHRHAETMLFRLVAVVAALHVADDGFVANEPGTTALDHALGSGLALLLIAAALAVYPRLRPGLRASAAITLGSLSLVVGVVALAHAAGVTPRGDDWTGILLVPGAVALLFFAPYVLWRSRKPSGHRFVRRGLLAAAGVLAAYWVVMPVGVALFATHRPREMPASAALGRPAREVVLQTRDGLRINGRYVASHNGAAVIVFPGSDSRAPQARMLARHGYGVLMLDMRGYGTSEGDPNAFGWGSTKDIDAGVSYLRGRSDVDPSRIGGIGFSVGGEQLIEAAARNRELRAVVSDGAGVRSIREAVLLGRGAWLTLPSYAVQTTAIALLSGKSPPAPLDKLAARIAPRPLFLIYAEHGESSEVELQPTFFAAAREPKVLWKVDDAGHTGGFAAQPREYERRLVGFFDRALLDRGAQRAHESR